MAELMTYEEALRRLPCDGAAVERVAQALARQASHSWDVMIERGFSQMMDQFRERALEVLRAAGETP